MIDPLIGLAAFLGAMLVPVLLARGAHSPPSRAHGIDHGAMAEIEENDIEQMLEGIAERRRRNGKPPIGDELLRHVR